GERGRSHDDHDPALRGRRARRAAVRDARGRSGGRWRRAVAAPARAAGHGPPADPAARPRPEKREYIMGNKIPVDTLYHASVVVPDARAAARNYAEFYGIDRWRVVHHTDQRLRNTTVHGRTRTAPPALDLAGPMPIPGAYTFTTATGRTASGIEFELVQPTLGLSTFEEFLVTRGEGVHGVMLAVVDPKDFPDLKAWLASEGVPVGQSFTVDDVADYVYFDTRKALGGFYVQVVVPRVADWEAAIEADEEWDFTGEVERPPGVEAIQRASGLTHFGVVVDDVVARVETFARLF